MLLRAQDLAHLLGLLLRLFVGSLGVVGLGVDVELDKSGIWRGLEFAVRPGVDRVGLDPGDGCLSQGEGGCNGEDEEQGKNRFHGSLSDLKECIWCGGRGSKSQLHCSSLHASIHLRFVGVPVAMTGRL